MNNGPEITVAADVICDLGECPVWNPTDQKLYWTDITKGKIWQYDPAQDQYDLYLQDDFQIGGFAFNLENELIVCTSSGVLKVIDAQSNEYTRLFPGIILRQGERFNDITTDPEGRIYAGTLIEGTNEGMLYLLQRDSEPLVVLENLGCSNGMTFSLDTEKFYHTDSIPRTITSYDYDQATGAIRKPVIFFKGDESQGFPDGITIDQDGNIWVAFWGEACLRKISPDSEILAEIMMPVAQPTSVMFGGIDLSELYITSAATGADNSQNHTNKDGNLMGGPLFKLQTETRGREEWRAYM